MCMNDKHCAGASMGSCAGNPHLQIYCHLTNILLTISCLNIHFDVATFDLKKAFEKVPHDKVLQELVVRGISGRELQWFANFYLSGRTHQIRLGNSFSSVASVPSDIVEGSVLGPDLCSIVASSLMRRLRLLNIAYADNFKFLSMWPSIAKLQYKL